MLVKVTALAGGVGGAKLLVGLDRAVGTALTAIVNTGDDARLYGVHVSPDVDIVTYWPASPTPIGAGASEGTPSSWWTLWAASVTSRGSGSEIETSQRVSIAPNDWMTANL